MKSQLNQKDSKKAVKAPSKASPSKKNPKKSELKFKQDRVIGDEVPFSRQLKDWLKSSDEQTLASLGDVFGDRTFAILFMVMMATSALPIPTGGVTDVFAVITVLVALQMMVGRKTLWLPQKWGKIKLGKTFRQKLIPALVRILERLEKFSKPRIDVIFSTRLGDFVIGLIVAIFAVATILAPPFSGLDTLPAMGVVVIAAAMLLRDGYIFIGGTVIGSLGLLLQFAFGAAIVRFIKSLFKN